MRSTLKPPASCAGTAQRQARAAMLWQSIRRRTVCSDDNRIKKSGALVSLPSHQAAKSRAGAPSTCLLAARMRGTLVMSYEYSRSRYQAPSPRQPDDHRSQNPRRFRVFVPQSRP